MTLDLLPIGQDARIVAVDWSALVQEEARRLRALGLEEGVPLAEAIEDARDFVRAALLAAPGFGEGHGPMGHHAVR